MEQKLTISEITYIRNLAEHKTDEELAKMINKPVALVQMQLSLISDLPRRPWERRPWEKGDVIQTEPAAKVAKPTKKPKAPKKQKPAKLPKPLKSPETKPHVLPALKIGRKKRTTKVGTKSKVKPGSQRYKQSKKAVKKREVVKVNEAVVQRQKEWKGKNDKAQFKTKAVDLTGLISYRLNAKTTVFDKPGANIAELKRKYNIV